MTSQKPQRKARKNKYTSHACTNCQKKKTRCLASDIPDMPCERCAKDGTECIFLPKKKRRGRRKKTTFANELVEIPDGSARYNQQSTTIMTNPSTSLIPFGQTQRYPTIPSFTNNNLLKGNSFSSLHTRRKGFPLDRIATANINPNTSIEVSTPDFLAPMFEEVEPTPLALRDETGNDNKQNMEIFRNDIDPLDSDALDFYPSYDSNSIPPRALPFYDSNLQGQNQGQMDYPLSYIGSTTPVSIEPDGNIHSTLDLPINPSIEPIPSLSIDPVESTDIDNGAIDSCDIPGDISTDIVGDMDGGEISPSAFFDMSDEKRFTTSTSDAKTPYGASTRDRNQPYIESTSLKAYPSTISYPTTTTPISTANTTSATNSTYNTSQSKIQPINYPVESLPVLRDKSRFPSFYSSRYDVTKRESSSEQLLPIARRGVISELDQALSKLPHDTQLQAIITIQDLVRQLERLGIQNQTTKFEEETDSTEFDDYSTQK